MGFTKLDSGIVQSSVMAEDGNTFKVWIVLLATCESDGISKVSEVYVSAVCRLSIEDTVKAIVKLESPDKYSRSQNDDGKRIERVDGGFRIINYHKYRDYTYSDSKDAVKKRAQRINVQVGDKCPDKGDTSPKQGDTLLLSSSSVLINSIELNKESIVLIVEYLNQTCGTSYRATSEKTAKHINARLNEKFTVEDFKTVIRFKNEQWGEDEKMKEYLRPETLFGSKFESYLQAAPRYEAYRVDSDEEETGPLLSIVDQIKADAERNKAGLNDKTV